MPETRNRDGVSFWLADALGTGIGTGARRPPRSGTHEARVCETEGTDAHSAQGQQRARGAQPGAGGAATGHNSRRSALGRPAAVAETLVDWFWGWPPPWSRTKSPPGEQPGTLPGLRRRLLPMNSSMIVTDPLAAHGLGQIGLRSGETLGDAAAWSGILGIAWDWCASVGVDARTGIAWAGGCTGHGVTTANLAGRTPADLILDTALTALPWVGRVSPGWEPEPLRWLESRPGAGQRSPR